jgi:hypothetical protein
VTPSLEEIALASQANSPQGRLSDSSSINAVSFSSARLAQDLVQSHRVTPAGHNKRKKLDQNILSSLVSRSAGFSLKIQITRQ